MTDPFDFKAGVFLTIPQGTTFPNCHDGHALRRSDSEFLWRDHKRAIRVHPPFWFDGASVGRGYVALSCSPLDLELPGLGHDASYRIDFQYNDLRELDARYRTLGKIAKGLGKTDLDSFAPRYTPDRHEADKMFSKMAKNCGADWDDCGKMYYVLRIAGRGSYHQKRMDWRVTP